MVVDESDYDNALQLVAQEIVKETRKYRSAVIRTLYNGLLGEYDNPAYFRKIYDQFEADGVNTDNMRELVLALIKLEDYRIDGVLTKGADEEDDVRSVRLVTAEIMKRKIHATLVRGWDTRLNDKSITVLFGGIDSDENTSRFTQMSGVSETLTELMASEMACYSVANDFRKSPTERVLFPHVEMSDQPESEETIARIKQNLVHLHKWVLQEDLSTTYPEIDVTYQVFKETYDEYKNSNNTQLAQACRIGVLDPEHTEKVYTSEASRINADNYYTIKSWMAVIQYLLLDFKFLHE
jgi:hypothetical protein